MFLDFICRDLGNFFALDRQRQRSLDLYIAQKHPKNIQDIERLTREFEIKFSQGLIS
jgi:hypothetical protein